MTELYANQALSKKEIQAQIVRVKDAQNIRQHKAQQAVIPKNTINYKEGEEKLTVGKLLKLVVISSVIVAIVANFV